MFKCWRPFLTSDCTSIYDCNAAVSYFPAVK